VWANLDRSPASSSRSKSEYQRPDLPKTKDENRKRRERLWRRPLRSRNHQAGVDRAFPRNYLPTPIVKTTVGTLQSGWGPGPRLVKYITQCSRYLGAGCAIYRHGRSVGNKPLRGLWAL